MEGIYGFLYWLSPFIMLNSVFTTRTFVLMNIVAGQFFFLFYSADDGFAGTFVSRLVLR